MSIIVFFSFLSITLLLFNKPLFTRKRLTKLQKLLFVTMLLLLMFWKYSFMHFLLRATHLFLCFLHRFWFSLVKFLKHLFLNLLLVWISFLRFLGIEGAWFPLMNFFCRGARLFTMLMKVLVRKSKFSFGSTVFRVMSQFLTLIRKLVLLNFL